MIRASPAGIPGSMPSSTCRLPRSCQPRSPPAPGEADGGPQGSEGLRVGGESTPGPGVLLASPRSRWGHAAAWVGEGLGPEL